MADSAAFTVTGRMPIDYRACYLFGVDMLIRRVSWIESSV